MRLFLLIILVFAGAAHAQVVTKTIVVDDVKTVLENHKGRPLVINFWATWCGPCAVEFPEIVRINNEYKSKGLDVVIVSIDNIGAIDYVVAEFLKSYESTMTSYLLDRKKDAAYRNIRRNIANAPQGVPLTVVFDRTGKVRYLKSGVFNASVLRANILAVLNPPATSGKNRPSPRLSLK